MIIYDPKAKGNGMVCERPVELLDMYPTIAAWAGLKAPANLEGKDLRPLLEDPKSPSDRAAFSQVTRMRKQQQVMGYSAHSERFRYTEWDFGKAGVELYDHETDADEFHNLAEDPAHAKDREKLHEMLKPFKPSTRPTAPAKPGGTD